MRSHPAHLVSADICECECLQALAGWGVCLLLVLCALIAILMLIGAALLIIINDG